MIRIISAVALIVSIILCFAEGDILKVIKDRNELGRCIVALIRQLPRAIYKITVLSSTENSAVVTQILREINSPVVINAVESRRSSLDAQVPSDLVLIFAEKVNVTLLLKQVLWYGDTKFILACGSGCGISDIFGEFWENRVLNVIAVVDDEEGIRLYSYRPFQSNNCWSTAPVVLDNWINGTFPNGGFGRINQVLKDVNQCPIKVSVTKIKPAVIFSDDSNSTYEDIDGTEVRFMKVVGEKLNFTANFSVPDDGLTWGTIFPPRGVMGTVYTAKSEFALGFISVTIERYEHLDLSRPFSGKECMTFAVPNGAGRGNLRWLRNITDNFWPLEWILIFMSLTNVIILISIARKYTLTTAFMYTFASFLGGPVKIPRVISVKLLTVFWVFYSLIINNIYQASLGSKITVPLEPSEIETLTELAESGLEITGHPNFKAPMMKMTNIPEVLLLGNRMKPVTYNVDIAIDHIARDRNTSYLRQLSVLRYAILSNEKAKENVRIMRECVVNLHTAVAMHRNSPFKKSVDDIMIRLSESGIYRYWRSQFLYKALHGPRHFTPLTLIPSLGVFILLIIGLSVAFTVFLLELRIKPLKQPIKRVK